MTDTTERLRETEMIAQVAAEIYRLDYNYRNSAKIGAMEDTPITRGQPVPPWGGHYYALARTAVEALPTIDHLTQALEEANERAAALMYAEHRSVMANVRLGRWLSAALDDPNVCDAMKADIKEWFSSGPPPHALSALPAPPDKRATALSDLAALDGETM